MRVTIKDRLKRKDYAIQIRVWDWLSEAIAQEAKKDGLSVSDWIREQLIKGVEK